MDSSAPSSQSIDPFPSSSSRFLELIGVCIAVLTLIIPFVAVLSSSTPAPFTGTTTNLRWDSD
jgi:hypothetical protein